jgi:Tfp pilus assembly protein PilF
MRFSPRILFPKLVKKSSRDCAQDVEVLEASERLIRLGNELEDTGRIEAALERYREAARLTPTEPRPYMNIGNALRRLARPHEALVAQRTAVSCSPEYAPARFNLAILLGDLGDLPAAEKELVEALERQPAMAEARAVLADIYEVQQRFDDAEAQFRLALDRTPDHAGILLNYGIFCFRQGRLE